MAIEELEVAQDGVLDLQGIAGAARYPEEPAEDEVRDGSTHVLTTIRGLTGLPLAGTPSHDRFAQQRSLL